MDQTLINKRDDLFNRLNQLGIKISLRDGQLVLNAPKGAMTLELREQISSLKTSIIDYLSISNEEKPELVKIHRTEKMPVSFAQQRMLFLNHLNPESPAYNISAAFHLKGNLNIPSMQKAVNEIIKRHETLRTTFHFDNIAYQNIHDNFELPLNIIQAENIEQAKLIAVNESQHIFNINELPLLRLSLIEFKISNSSEKEYLMILVIHHIIADAWSCGIFAQELSVLYKSYIENTTPVLPELKIQYSDYAEWQKKLLQGKTLENQLHFWKENLKDTSTFLPLATDKKRPDKQRFKGSVISIDVPKELINKLKKSAQSMSTTLFVYMISAFQVLLHRYTNKEDILTGYPIAGRHHKGIESLIGFFVNTMVLRGKITEGLNFRDFVLKNHEIILDSFINQDLPFEKLVESLHLPRNINYTPLFQVMFVMQNITAELPHFPELEFNLLELDNQTSKFDLTLSIKNECTTFSIEYNTDIFNKNTITNFLENYLVLLNSVAESPEKEISKLNIISEKQYQAVTNKWQPTKSADPENITIHRFIENQAQINPDKIAVTFENENLSYKHLNEKANQLAYKIKETINTNNSQDILIALSLDISFEMIISLLAILKSGYAYVPLDPTLPKERLNFILEDCQPSLLITTSDLKEKLPDVRKVFYLDLEKDSINQQPSDNLDLDISNDATAYIIYTSGSTGKPNGVAVSHKNVVRLFETTNECFEFNSADKWVLFHSFAFDYSVWEIWGCFYWGAKLLLVSKQMTRDPEKFYQKICEEKVTILNQTPSAFYHFSREATKSSEKNSLKWIVLSGEALDIELLRDWYDKFDDVNPKIVNSYGITETTVFVTFKLLTKNDLNDFSRSPIGVGLSDLQLYILDKEKNPVPYGVSGELYVGGLGVTKGYLNRPELNKQRFISNPFKEGRLYKTGDHVRAITDGHNNGEIEFLGRLDHQIKIRGFRIELGEIETYLNKLDIIKEAVVLVDEDSNKGKYLIAYIVLSENEKFQQNELQNYLRTKLPEVMIPSVFITLDKFPLNNNGKVDKKSLPKPDNKRPEMSTAYIPPNNVTEKLIAETIQNLLNIEKVGLHDNFFDIGGHSLLMVEAHKSIQDKTNKSFALIDIFNYPTIHLLAKFLDKSGNNQFEEIKDKAKSRAKLRKSSDDNSIAIIGMSGRFPGADDVEKFWENISNGVESVSFFSDDELRKAGVSESLIKNPKYVKANAVLDDIDLFDADFFGYNPREAEIIDPQQRIFLECAYHALEDAGYHSENSDLSIGIFAGSSISRYLLFNLSRNQEIIDAVGHFQLLTANDKDYLATRTAYKLNLKGPGITIQTACSTSLVAVHTACQSLISGESDIALAGGISIDIHRAGYLYQEGAIASPDGHCRAFDEKSGGIVGGSGAGIVVLKRLKDAIKDNDNIYAVIKGSAVNNDGGHKIGFLAPGIDGQTEVISNALAVADVHPEDIDYIEAHGTATQIGDPIEIESLTRAYKSYTDKKNYCAIGSVKTNIGHLDMASGISGLIKTVQALRYKKLPPSLHFEKPNKRINFADSPFYVNTKLQEWSHPPTPFKGGVLARDTSITNKQSIDSGDRSFKRGGSQDTSILKKRIAGVSSFGVGGTNAHVILEEFSDSRNESAENTEQILVLSAKNEESLDKMSENLSEYFNNLTDKNISLADIAYTLQVGRREFNYRRMFVANNLEDAKNVLNNYHNKATDYHLINNVPHKIVFMFSGLGTQYSEMGKELYEKEEVFRNEFDKCADILLEKNNLDLREILFGVNIQDSDIINKPSVMQPVIFTIQYALAKLWQSKGIEPYALIGHSFGEYTAFCISGVITLDEALDIVSYRGQLFEEIKGSMLAVSAGYEKIEPLLKKNIFIANINANNFYTFAGTEETIKEFQVNLKKNRIASQILEVPHATHCDLVNVIVDRYLEKLDKVEFKTPKYPIISNLTGEWINDSDLNKQYFINHMLKPVKFYDGLKHLSDTLAGTDALFLEIGAGSSLNHLIKKNNDILPDAVTLISLPIKQNKEQTYQQFLNSLGKLWLHGIKINWANGEDKPRRVSLPKYPFERKRFWVNPSADFIVNSKNDREEDISNWFYITSWKRASPSQLVSQGTTKSKNVLVFSDEQFFNKTSSNNIQDYSDNIIKVFKGNEYKKLSENHFIINADLKSDYEMLFQDLTSNNIIPEKIIYSWTLENSNYLNNSFYYLMYLIQCISTKENVDIKIISDNVYKISGFEELVPEKSVLNGILQVTNQEYGNITCQNIDIDNYTNIEKVIKEIFSEKVSSNSIVAYRNNFRWIQTFEKENISTSSNIDLLRNNGTYIIIGGLGGIGLSIADFIAKNYQSNIVLISRNEFPDEKDWDNLLKENSDKSEIITKLLVIKKNASSLVIEQGDITDKSQMKNIFLKVAEKYKTIDGIINSTGVTSSGLINNKTIEKAENIFAVKITGTNNIIELAKELNIKNVVLFSSLSTVLGGVAQSDYIAANSYLNSLAESYFESDDLKVTSINWSAWKEVGMAKKMYANFPELKAISESMDNSSITTEEGNEIFKRAFNSQHSQVYVSPVELEALQKKYKKFSLSEGKNLLKEMIKLNSERKHLYSRPKVSTEYVEAKTELEKVISEIWQNILGIEKIGVNDNFFELGGHSLLMAGIKIQLEEKLGKELAMSVLFNSSTIEEMAEYIENEDKNNKSLVAMKTTGNKTPFFCVHAISGTAFPFTDIVHHFDPDRPFYAFQSQGFSNNSEPLDNISNMADLYIQELKEMQKDNNYLIGGWSFGGLVALEMAKKMINQGNLVNNLIIIDMQAPDNNSVKPEIDEEWMTQRFIEDIKGIFGENVSLEDKNIQNIYKVFKNNIKATASYQGENYNGKITVFKASNNTNIDMNDKLGWDKISDDVTVYNIEGDHYSILKSPELFEKLNKLL